MTRSPIMSPLRPAVAAPCPNPTLPSPPSVPGDARALSDDPILTWEEAKLIATRRALRANGGNVHKASRALGIGRATLYRYLLKHNIRYRDP